MIVAVLEKRRVLASASSLTLLPQALFSLAALPVWSCPDLLNFRHTDLNRPTHLPTTATDPKTWSHAEGRILQGCGRGWHIPSSAPRRFEEQL